MYVVTVTFRIAETRMEEFLPLMTENARTSLAEETGCHQFDVCRTPGENLVFLYEIYSDKAAFDTHLASAHFKAFDRAVADMIVEKSVAVFEELIR